MLSWIGDILGSLFGFVASLLNLLYSTLKSLFTLIAHLPDYINFAMSLNVAFPSFALVFIIAGVSLTVVLFVKSLSS